MSPAQYHTTLNVASYPTGHSPAHRGRKIDSHQHFWQLERGDYCWLTADMPELYHDKMPEHFQCYREQYHLSASVVVQAAPTLEETMFLLSLADQYPWIGAVVGWVDFSHKDVLGQLRSLSEHPKLVGVRPMIQDISDVDWMLNHDFSAVFSECVARGLSFDALVKPEHLSNLHILLRRHPDLDAVIDHAGKPNIKAQQFDRWATDIQILAEDTGAHCKISGVLTQAGEQATSEDLEPYIHHLLTCFGSKRLMWGSDWPVVNVVADYAAWVNSTETLIAELSCAEKSDIWYNTAKRFYKISDQ